MHAQAWTGRRGRRLAETAAVLCDAELDDDSAEAVGAAVALSQSHELLRSSQSVRNIPDSLHRLAGRQHVPQSPASQDEELILRGESHHGDMRPGDHRWAQERESHDSGGVCDTADFIILQKDKGKITCACWAATIGYRLSMNLLSD